MRVQPTGPDQVHASPATSSTPSNEAPAPGAFRFRVRTLADPAMLLRVLELFALRDFVPRHVECRRDDGAGQLHVELMVEGMTVQQARHLEVRMGQFPYVVQSQMWEEPASVDDFDYRAAVYQLRKAVRPGE